MSEFEPPPGFISHVRDGALMPPPGGTLVRAAPQEPEVGEDPSYWEAIKESMSDFKAIVGGSLDAAMMETAADPMATAEAAGRGAMEGSSFGFSGELQGQGAGLADVGRERAMERGMGAPVMGQDAGQDMAIQEAEAMADKNLAQAREASPIAAYGGELAGSVAGAAALGGGLGAAGKWAQGGKAALGAGPASIGQALGGLATGGGAAQGLGRGGQAAALAAEGSILGAVEGAGRSEGDFGSREMGQDMAMGMALGGAVPGALAAAPVAWKALRGALGGGKASKGLQKLNTALSDSANKELLGHAGYTKQHLDALTERSRKTGDDLMAKEVRKLFDEGLVDDGVISVTSKARIRARARELEKDSGKIIGDVISEVDGKQAPLNTEALADELRKRAEAEIRPSGDMPTYRKVMQEADQMEELGNRMSFKRLWEQRKRLNADARGAKWNAMSAPGEREGSRFTSKFLTELQNQRIQEIVPPARFTEWTHANEQFSVAASALDGLEKTANWRAAGTPGGLLGSLAGIAGAVTGGPLGAIGGAASGLAADAVKRQFGHQAFSKAMRGVGSAAGGAGKVAGVTGKTIADIGESALGVAGAAATKSPTGIVGKLAAGAGASGRKGSQVSAEQEDNGRMGPMLKRASKGKKKKGTVAKLAGSVSDAAKRDRTQGGAEHYVNSSRSTKYRKGVKYNEGTDR